MFNDNIDLLRTIVDAIARLDVNVVVTTGPGSDPQRLGPVPDHVAVYAYVPHDLLPPRCSLVVSQAGAGIMFAALAHRLPQLLLPQGADQFANAEACVAAGVATSFVGDVSPVDITRTADRLQVDAGVAAAVARLGDEIDAMPDAAEALAEVLGRTALR